MVFVLYTKKEKSSERKKYAIHINKYVNKYITNRTVIIVLNFDIIAEKIANKVGIKFAIKITWIIINIDWLKIK